MAESAARRYEPTNLEKESLEAHVDLCAERYNRLDERLTQIYNTCVGFESYINEFKDTMQADNSKYVKLLFGSTATIMAGILSTVVALLISGKI